MTNSRYRPDRLRVVRLLPALDFGGVESRVVLQAKLHDRTRFDLQVVALGNSGDAAQRIRAAGVPVHVLGVRPAPRSVQATLAVRQCLAELRPHVLHSSIAEGNFHASMATLLARPPVLFAEEVGVPDHGLAARLVFRFAYRRGDAAIGVTKAVCDYMQRVDGCPRDRVQLIYNCAGPDFFPAPPVSRQERASGEPFKMLMVGRLVSVKNHDTLLRAFAQVTRRHPAVVLQIAGTGPLEASMRSLVDELGVRDQVELLGFRSDVQELLRGADLFVLPSLSEGCSISLIEAMASGTPAIGSKVPGIEEVLGPLAAEATCPATDVEKWVELLERYVTLPAGELRALGQRAQERAYAQFSPQAYVSNVERLYDELWSARRNVRFGWPRALRRAATLGAFQSRHETRPRG